ncbi:MAG: hypothetical protein LBC63_06540 [Holophagales bacterium]|jgi:DUF4097 and DUF4098 domain-containing protein YvlB|nr:hypothetical protein [Holophagales bacterium]
MRNIASIAILAACIAVAATAQTSVIQPTGPSPAKETKTFVLQSGGDLKITNVNGGIKITAHDKDEVTLTATFKPSRRNNEYPRIEVDSKNNYLELIVKYPKEKNEAGSCEMELSVPRRINSKIITVNGGIALNEINGSHKLRAVNGGISFDIATGKVEASTVNGGIVAIQKNEGNVEASTVNGGIILTLSDPNGTLSASTVNGEVTLNTPGARDITKKQSVINATFGNGDAKIKLTTVNGSIVVQ